MGLGKAFFNDNVLDLQCSYFKMIMVANSEQIMKEKSLMNPVVKLWTKISSFLSSNTSFQNL
jgi:hypothetical protein